MSWRTSTSRGLSGSMRGWAGVGRYEGASLFCSLPPLGFHLLSPRRERRQGCGRVAPRQVDPGLAERETVRLRKMRGGCQVALAQQRQYVRGYNFRHTIHQVVLARGQAGLGKPRGRAGHVALGQFQAGKHHLTGNTFVGVF
jgi:hypothetical protein